MSFFKKFIGKKESKPPKFSKAIVEMKNAEDALNKKQKYLEKKIENEIKTAKLNAKKNRKAALQALQRKKRYEKQLQQIDSTLTTLEIQREAVENAQTNDLAFNSMKTADEALKSTHKKINVKRVEDLLEELAEEREISSEITDAFCTSSSDELDEDELLLELEQLELEENGKVKIPDELPKEAVRDKADKHDDLKEEQNDKNPIKKRAEAVAF